MLGACLPRCRTSAGDDVVMQKAVLSRKGACNGWLPRRGTAFSMAAALALLLSVQPPCVCLSPAYAETVMPPASMHLGKFSGLTAGDELGAPWRLLSFENIPRKTRYRLVSEVVDGRRITVLEARSEQSASGMVRDVDIDPREYPLLRWYWKVPRALAGSEIASKAGDDFAARIYVTFALEDDASMWERFKISVFRAFMATNPPGGH